jgi:hypothetical protein
MYRPCIALVISLSGAPIIGYLACICKRAGGCYLGIHLTPFPGLVKGMQVRDGADRL